MAPSGTSNVASGGSSAVLSLISALGGAAAASLAFYVLQKDTIISDLADSKVGGNNSSSSSSSSQHASPSPASPGDTLALIRHRRSIFPKQYTGESVGRAVIDAMLDAARFAPSHKLTEAWRFVVFESETSRAQLGKFMAEQYKAAQEATGKEVMEAKYDKKIKNSAAASHVLAIIVDTDGPNPAWEEIASVSMAVQNMLLVAAAHNVGAYWSSGSVVDGDVKLNENAALPDSCIATAFNPAWREIMRLSDSQHCLGLAFVGRCKDGMKWPSGKKKDITDKTEWK